MELFIGLMLVALAALLLTPTQPERPQNIVIFESCPQRHSSGGGGLVLALLALVLIMALAASGA